MKTIEQRIAERAEADLKFEIGIAIGRLRTLLAGDEAQTVTEVKDLQGDNTVLTSVGALLALVEQRVFDVSAIRHCDYAIEAALDELQHRIYPQQGNAPFIQGQMPTMPTMPAAPSQATARRGN